MSTDSVVAELKRQIATACELWPHWMLWRRQEGKPIDVEEFLMELNSRPWK